MLKQPLFYFQQATPGVARVTTDAVCRNNSMAGYDRRDRVTPAGIADSTRRCPQLFRQFTITHNLSWWYFYQRIPDLLLERSA